MTLYKVHTYIQCYHVGEDQDLSRRALARLVLILRASEALRAANDPDSLVGKRDHGLRLCRSSRAIANARPTYIHVHTMHVH